MEKVTPLFKPCGGMGKVAGMQKGSGMVADIREIGLVPKKWVFVASTWPLRHLENDPKFLKNGPAASVQKNYKFRIELKMKMNKSKTKTVCMFVGIVWNAKRRSFPISSLRGLRVVPLRSSQKVSLQCDTFSF